MPESEIQYLPAIRLNALVGLPLSIARNAADMKMFHFGPVSGHPSGSGTIGTHALHVQCPWRIVSGSALITGNFDRWSDPSTEREIDEDDQQSGNLQSARLFSLLKGYDSRTRSHVNATAHFVVLSVSFDLYCGLDIAMSGGYHLQVIPTGSRDEEWRLIETSGSHLVMGGGRMTS